MPDDLTDVAFVTVEVETDATVLADNAIAALKQNYPTWAPQEGSLAVRQIEAIAPLAQNAAEVASIMPRAALRSLGTTLWNIPYSSGASAVAITTWTLADNKGHTIEAGTAISIGDFAFTVDIDVVVPVGQFVATNVGVTAVDEGTAANGQGNPVEPISAPDWVDMVTIAGVTANGADPESDDSYENRFSALLTLMSLTPVTESNFALLARFAGVPVGRSMAIAGYNVSNDSYDNGRYMAVFVTGTTGSVLTTTQLATIRDFLIARREANFVVTVSNHGSPLGTYTEIDVTYNVTPYLNYDQTVLRADIDLAVRAFINPLTWGQPISGVLSSGAFTNETVVRKDKVIAVIDNVPGVNYVNSVTLASHTGSPAPDAGGNIALSGPAPLPTVRPVTGVSGVFS